MKSLTIITSVACCLMSSIVQAEFMEITASQIVTVEATDKADKPSILVQWDLPKNLDELIIDGAVITMTIPVDSAEPIEVGVHQVTKAWDAKEVLSLESWSKGDAVYDEDVVSPAIVTAQNEGRMSADVYLQVREQVLGKSSNFGFIVVPDPESTCKLSEITANDNAKLADAKLIIAYRTRR